MLFKRCKNGFKCFVSKDECESFGLTVHEIPTIIGSEKLNTFLKAIVDNAREVIDNFQEDFEQKPVQVICQADERRGVICKFFNAEDSLEMIHSIMDEITKGYINDMDSDVGIPKLDALKSFDADLDEIYAAQKDMKDVPKTAAKKQVKEKASKDEPADSNNDEEMETDLVDFTFVSLDRAISFAATVSTIKVKSGLYKYENIYHMIIEAKPYEIDKCLLPACEYGNFDNRSESALWCYFIKEHGEPIIKKAAIKNLAALR